jgi:hypothetical protein
MGTTKDADMSPFEAARRLLGPESKALSIGDRMDMVYQDADLVPLLIQVCSCLWWTELGLTACLKGQKLRTLGKYRH